MADLSQAFSEIKSLPDNILEREIAQPSGMIPGWLALGEIHERKALRATHGGNSPTKRPSMAEEYAGNIRNIVAGSGMQPPQQQQPPPTQPVPPQGQGIAGLPQQGYARGGLVSLANGNPLLAALLRNESGGRNIANTTQGTSSGQAQGYFQITTGTWKDFGGNKFAPNPMKATYEQQAEIASKIPLKRWDTSTLQAMRATGHPIYPNRTLGENLGQNFAGGATDGGQPVMTEPAAVAQAANTDVASTAAETAGNMAGAEAGAGEAAVGGDPMSQMMMMSMLMGGKGGQGQAAPPPSGGGGVSQARPVDASQYVQNPAFMQRMRSSNYG